MATTKYVVICYILACFYSYGTLVNKNPEKLSSCVRYGRCYNPSWCDSVLTSSNCSQKHLVSKLECLSTLLDDISIRGQLSDTVKSLTENVTNLANQLDYFKKENLEIVRNCNETKAELFSKCKDFYDKILSLSSYSNGLKQKQIEIENRTSEFNFHCEKNEKAIKILQDKISNIELKYESVNSNTLMEHKKIDDRITEVKKEVNDRIDSSETHTKQVLSDVSKGTNETVLATEKKMLFNQEKLNETLKSLNDTLSKHVNTYNETFRELRKEMNDVFDRNESKRKLLEKRMKHMNDNIGNYVNAKTENLQNKFIDNTQNMSKQLTDEINGVSAKLNSEIEKIDYNITQLSEKLKNLEENLKHELKSETKKLTVNIDNNIKKFNSKIENLNKSTNVGMEGIKADILNLEDKLDNVKTESDRKRQEMEKSLTTMIHERFSEAKLLLSESVKKLENTIEGLRSDVGKQITREVEALSQQTLEVNQTVLQQQKLVEVIYPNTFNKEMFIIAFLGLVVLVAINFAISYVLVKRSSPQAPARVRKASVDVGQHAIRPGEEPHSPVEGNNAILQKLPDSPVFPPGVCIISYDEARKECHRKLLESSNIPKCDVKSYVIRSHEDIVNLPRNMVYIMCTEFSERHVIIEEPGIGLGDLHRTTYHAVKKFGGGLIILYTKDPGSRKLKSPENPALYNADIYCVQKQPELIALEQNNEFYSIYDELSDHQKSKLRQRIEHYMT